VDGSFVARAGIEFALRYAEGVGSDAEVTFAIATEPEAEDERVRGPSFHDTSPMFMPRKPRDSILFSVRALAEGGLSKLSPVFNVTKVKTHLVTTGRAHSIPTHLATGKYDLLVMGVESRAIYHRLFFGHENERLIEECAIPVVLLVAKVNAA
jgi:hypothetical protein